ncbi:MAG: CHASE domain-containing protein [Thiobacillus sp.]
MRAATMRRLKFPQMVGSIVFLLAAFVSGVIVWQIERHFLESERARAVHLAADHAHSIEYTIVHALSASQALAALVRQGNGNVPGFESLAGTMLPFYPGASALALAPGGVVRDIAPMPGNEAAIGLDLLNTPALRKESLLARDSGELTLAGPLELAMGGWGWSGGCRCFLRTMRGMRHSGASPWS